MNITTRVRAYLCAVLALGLLAACGGAGGGEGKTLKVGIQAPYSAYVLRLAEQQGFLKEIGIDNVEFTTFRDIPAMITAVAKRQIDLGSQTIPALSGYNASTREDTVRILYSRGVNLVNWTARNSSGIPVATDADWQDTVRSWKGKKIGVPALGGIVDKQARYFVSAVGLVPGTDVQFVPVGGGQAAVAAMRQGLVDVLGGDSSVTALVQTGGLGNIVLGNKQGPPEMLDTISTGWFAADAAINSDTALYQGIVRANKRAIDFLNNPANKSVCLDVLARDVGVSPDVAERMYELDAGTFNSPINQQTFEHTVDAYAKAGIMDNRPSYDSVVSPIAE